tara:strand:- start:4778 stop:5488 length:711 start_codon:yes stop_codon:yes gene_type:complete
MVEKSIIYKTKKFKLFIPETVFQPTATTNFLLDQTYKIIKKTMKILDLGCGCGVIGILLSKKFNFKNKIYASDASINAIKIAKKNFKKYKLSHSVKHGSLYSPWKGEKFDLIINDVSGVSSILAKKSNWFKNVPCNTGLDGSNLTIKILDQSSKFLNKKGKIILPIISLSNVNKLLKFSNEKFKKVEILSKNEWFLPQELLTEKKLLNNLKKKKFIDFKIKFGKIICYTLVIICHN